MKYTWEDGDIVCGRYACRDLGREDCYKPSGWHAKWTFKIGYQTTAEKGTLIALVCMSDGMVTVFETKAALVARLNKDEMIPMPHSWLLRLIEYMRGWYESI